MFEFLIRIHENWEFIISMYWIPIKWLYGTGTDIIIILIGPK